MLSKWRHYVWCISLLLCAAIALLWVRSYWVSDDWSRDAYGLDSGRVFHKALLIRSSGGGLALARKVYTNGDPGVVSTWRPARFAGFPLAWRSDPSVQYPAGGPLLPTLSWWTKSGFGLSLERPRSSGYFSQGGFALVVPDWSLLIAAALLPFVWLIRLWLVAHRKAMEGRCRRCGYDLRATPDRCPECGTQVVQADSRRSILSLIAPRVSPSAFSGATRSRPTPAVAGSSTRNTSGATTWGGEAPVRLSSPVVDGPGRIRNHASGVGGFPRRQVPPLLLHPAGALMLVAPCD